MVYHVYILNHFQNLINLSRIVLYTGGVVNLGVTPPVCGLDHKSYLEILVVLTKHPCACMHVTMLFDNIDILILCQVVHNQPTFDSLCQYFGIVPCVQKSSRCVDMTIITARTCSYRHRTLLLSKHQCHHHLRYALVAPPLHYPFPPRAHLPFVPIRCQSSSLRAARFGAPF